MSVLPSSIVIDIDSCSSSSGGCGSLISSTGSDSTICGVVGGASAQSGLIGAGVSSESFACLAHKHQLYQNEAKGLDSVIEGFSWYFPPFLVTRIVRSAIFN